MSYVQTSSGFSPTYGEFLDPPECEPDNPVTCPRCRDVFDADDDEMYVVEGELTCLKCVERCSFCDELIHDDTNHSECKEDEDD